ncbi:hypothetical protein NUW58_g1536 [Xylaria curta]|uniref:Uncharacterized protein n=2 Tax=Xylaria curta TaxID=42375 RepID=A0ACC1N4M6_9PEZI|nr:hypothetical protein NUW58_g8734 [Xylaria curta]KAJ2994516.1 hypothetical protein NUW58_g1536 [Xylaria curta]
MQFSTYFLAALSMGSALAAPLVDIQIFNTAAAELTRARNTIHQQAAAIKLLVGGAPTVENVNKIRDCATIVGQNLNILITPSIALGSIGSTSLTKAQLAAIPKFAEDFRAIILDVELIGKTISHSRLSRDQLTQVKPELEWALATTSPLARPILAFIKLAAPSYYQGYYGVPPALLSIQALINIDLAVFIGIGISL